MKEHILDEEEEEESITEEIQTNSLTIRESEKGTTNKNCNYKFWIIIFSTLDFISLLLLIISAFAIKTKVIW
jgi:hypothetical protein